MEKLVNISYLLYTVIGCVHVILYVLCIQICDIYHILYSFLFIAEFIFTIYLYMYIGMHIRIGPPPSGLL